MYSTFRNFRNRVADFLRFRQVRYRAVTAQTARQTDAVTAPCSHVFVRVCLVGRCSKVPERVHLRCAILQVSARLDRLPDASAEDLSRSDGVCIICREEMTASGTNKKLFCGHVFHLHCLRYGHTHTQRHTQRVYMHLVDMLWLWLLELW